MAASDSASSDDRMAGSEMGIAGPPDANEHAVAAQLTKQLSLLEDGHQLELARNVELERTVENLRSQLRSLSAMRSADKRQAEVLKGEITTLREMLHGREAPPASVELRQVEAARAVSEARADAAAQQLDNLREEMQIGQAEQARQAEEVTLLRAQLAANTEMRLTAQRQVTELQRSLRVRDQRVAAHDAQVGLLQGRVDATRDRSERATAQVAELRRQLEASQGELDNTRRALAEARSRATAAAAAAAAEGASRAELKALLTAADARLVSQGAELAQVATRLAKFDARGSAEVMAAEEAAVRPALTQALAEAERAASALRVKLDEERFARRAAEGAVQAAEEQSLALRAREEKLDEELGAVRQELREADEAREAERRDMERLKDIETRMAGEGTELAKQLETVEGVLSGHAEREAELLSEVDKAKRAQVEAERQVDGLTLSLRQQEARVLQAEQRHEEAIAAMEPLRMQAEHARETVSIFEKRLADSMERLGTSEATVSELQSQLLHVGEVESRQSAGAIAELEGELSAARAEIAAWSSRQQLLASHLTAERETNKARAAQLSEAQEGLSSMRHLVIAAKEEELADAHRNLRLKEEAMAEVARRADKMADQLSVAREELKLRAEQQRLTSERLRDAEERLRSSGFELSMKDQAASAQQMRAEGAAERLAQSSAGFEALQAQLSSAHEQLARLGQEVETVRARERRAVDDSSFARDQSAVLEARLEGAQARADALAEKARVSREGRLQVQQVLEQREAELRAARRDLGHAQSNLAAALEGQLR